MSVFPIGAIFAALIAVAALAGLRWGARPSAMALGAAVPMSAGAAAVLSWAGGASLLLATLAAAGFAGVVLLGALRSELRGEALRAPGPALILIIFAVFAVVGALALPRIFAGATLVFPLDRTAVGVTGGALKLPLLPLQPRAGAVTQSLYLLSSVAVFLAAVRAASRDDGLVGAALWAATISHVVFAALDISGSALIEYARTAAYQIASAQSFAGLSRLTGAATEPSQFGLVSAALAAWHLWRWRDGGGALSGAVAAVLAALAVASLSTTALVALASALSWFAAGSLRRPRGMGELAVGALISAGLIALGGWVALGPYGAAAEAAFDAMFRDKLVSESGVERAIWASQALTNFRETMGFGAGLGAAKASGWVTALLGQTGVPGAVLMALFLGSVFLRPTADRAARAAAGTVLIGALLSEARVDLGYLFFLTAGAVVAARVRPSPAPFQRYEARHAQAAA